MRKIDQRNASFWAAVHNQDDPGAMGMLERQRTATWLRNTYAAFDACPCRNGAQAPCRQGAGARGCSALARARVASIMRCESTLRSRSPWSPWRWPQSFT